MVEPPDIITEERQEYMVSLIGDVKPILRTAHFLKPSLTSSDDSIFEFPSHSLSFVSTSFKPKKWPLWKVSFKGWRHPQKDWKAWVDRLHSLHQSTWEKAGIYEAIMGSTYKIQRNSDLVFGIAERWCSETNTFIFPWGEATITLEDMMVLGGYSVLGDPVFSPPETREMTEINEKLNEVRLEITRTKAQKACQYAWLRHFMENESEFEHEAFLSLWLSRFVFPKKSFNIIVRCVFPIAIHLARGKRIALAPAVLASIYRDLSLLKKAIVGSTKLNAEDDEDDVLAVAIWSPLQLVQIWAWERFVTLRSKPNLLQNGEPRFAQWNKLKMLKGENVRLALDSAGECFQWRPYTSMVNNGLFHKFYGEKEDWVSIDHDSDSDLVSFARCLRACELVGIDCIEHYLPHRVAMQFGMDQDLPDHVARCNETRTIAWRSYSKPIWETKLYIPSRFFESGVTTRYLKWWKQSFLGRQDSIKGFVWKQRSPKSLKSLPRSSKDKKGDNDAAVPPGFPSKRIRVEGRDFDEEDKLTILEMMESRKKNYSVGKKPAGDGKPLPSAQSQSVSSSTSDDGTTRKMESMMEPGENIMHSEESMGGPERAMEDKSESKARSPINNRVSINDYEGVNNSYGTLEIPGLELEARISKLEKVIAGLNAKYGYKFKEKIPKEGP